MKKTTMLAALAFGLMTMPAMAVDFTAKINDDDGKPMCAIQDKDGACVKFFTLGMAVRNALDSSANMQGITAAEKDRRGELGQGLIGASNPTLLESDLKMIREAIGNAYPPSIVHKAWVLLDAEPAKKK